MLYPIELRVQVGFLGIATAIALSLRFAGSGFYEAWARLPSVDRVKGKLPWFDMGVRDYREAPRDRAFRGNFANSRGLNLRVVFVLAEFILALKDCS